MESKLELLAPSIKRIEEELEVSLCRLNVSLENLVTVRLLIPLPGYDY
jgi:hypothetical protein